MPILSVNQFGQIYQTSGDTEDMGGFGAYPEQVHQGDVTLGAAYLKAQQAHTKSILDMKQKQKLQDELEAQQKVRLEALKRAKARSNMAQAERARNPLVQNAVMHLALTRPPRADYRLPLSGNALSANGQHGYDGMTRDARVINGYTMGYGNQAHHVDRSEAEQQRHMAEAMRILRLSARR